MPEEARGHVHVDAGGGSGEDAGPKSGGERLEEGDAHECRQDDVQGIDAPVVYDLVDHEQECDRRRQGQPLDQEGGDQQLHQHVAAPGEGGAQRTGRGGAGRVSRAGRGEDRECRHAGPAAPEAPPREPPGHAVSRLAQFDPEGPHPLHQPPVAVPDLDEGGGYQLPGRPALETGEDDRQPDSTHRPGKRFGVDVASLPAKIGAERRLVHGYLQASCEMGERARGTVYRRIGRRRGPLPLRGR